MNDRLTLRSLPSNYVLRRKRLFELQLYGTRNPKASYCENIATGFTMAHDSGSQYHGSKDAYAAIKSSNTDAIRRGAQETGARSR